jgi:hypothetical protein
MASVNLESDIWKAVPSLPDFKASILRPEISIKDIVDPSQGKGVASSNIPSAFRTDFARTTHASI